MNDKAISIAIAIFALANAIPSFAQAPPYAPNYRTDVQSAPVWRPDPDTPNPSRPFSRGDTLDDLAKENEQLRQALLDAQERIQACTPQKQLAQEAAPAKKSGGISGAIRGAINNYQQKKQQEAEYMEWLKFNHPELYVTMKEQDKDREAYENQSFMDRAMWQNVMNNKRNCPGRVRYNYNYYAGW